MLRRSIFRQSQAALQQSLRITKTPKYRSQLLSIQRSSIPPRICPKYYSTATEPPKKSSEEAAQASQTSDGQQAKPSDSASSSDDTLKKDVEAKDREIIDLKDKYLRSVADFRNLQDRTKRDVDTARNFAIARFASDLIESVDNLDRALTTVPRDKIDNSPDDNKELVNLYQGLKMTETILMQTLKKHGLERFDPSENGDPFNPNLHEATFQTRVEGKEDGTVFDTQQKGFILNGRVVRAAKVGVVKNS